MKKFFVFSIMFCILATTFCGSLLISNTYVGAAEVEITSKAALLMDVASGETLFEKDSTVHLPVASMVKMMTILLTLEEIENQSLTLDTMVTTSENASSMGGSQIFIDPFVEYRVEDLLKGVIVASANDASVALAEHICGSEKAFVQKMNAKAKMLGMNDTNYSNCTGLPAPEQYSCAKDCAILLNEVIKSDIYHKYSTIWMDEIEHPSGRKTELVNTNRLIRYYEGCDSGKTGSTNEAGCCLSASAKKNGMRLISVVVGSKNSQTRFNECSMLFNYGFANFENKSVLNIDAPVKTIGVDKGKQDSVDVYPSQNYTVLVKKGENEKFDVDFVLPEKIKAPVVQGDVVGKAVVSKNGAVVKEIDLLLKTDIEKLGLKDCFDKIVENW